LNLESLEDRHLLAAAITTLSVPISPAPVAGTQFTSVVASFTDSDNNTDPAQYAATIHWGNGHTSTGTVVTDPNGGFDVKGTNTYARAGTFAVSVSILDKDGDQATARTTNQVLDAPITATGTTVQLGPNNAIHNGVVANFTVANPFAKAADFTATIDWGDGTSSAGVVGGNPTAGFRVRGTHTYGAFGVFSVKVNIQEGGPNAVLTSYYAPANLISNGAVPADHTDPNLVNPWGIVSGPATARWINLNGSGTVELTDGAGNPNAGLPSVTIPPPNGSPAGTTSAPTGIVFNDVLDHPNDFVIHGGSASGASIFLFATEDGTISGWNPTVSTNGSTPSTQAFLAVDNSTENSVFKGLALLDIPSGNPLAAGQYLFATDFRNNKLDIFDSQFKPVTVSADAFHDPDVPADYAPFGVQAVNGDLVVTYAQQDAAKHDDVAGVGHGFVDIFSPAGTLLQRLGGGGFQPEFNSPWGIVMAPSDFGRFSNDLLIGNFGDSRVSAFDPKTGAFLGQLSDAQGHPLVLTGGFQGTDTKGLWGMAFGNGDGSGPGNTLFFASGINDEADGLFGSLTAASFSTATASSVTFSRAQVMTRG